MNKQAIEKIMIAQQNLADRNYQNYQDTGIQRYWRTYQKADDIAQICQQALAAADDHQAAIIVKLDLQQFAARAIRLVHDWDDENAKQLIQDLAAWDGCTMSEIPGNK